ncbi:MAG: hypothetical protein HYV51_02070 [Parcubacteria group bacterium]|nr:hypothetical protein [Parcubacteria group bacterium]
MKLYSFTIILLLIFIIAGGVSIAKNFDFFKKIPAAVFLFSNNIINRFLNVGRPEETILQKPARQMGIYTTVWISRSSKNIEKRIDLIDRTELTAVVIDVKDSGAYIDDYTKQLVGRLHEHGIYAIARLVVFQDSSQIKAHPDWYFKKSDGYLWVDNRGWYWMDPENRETWAYNVDIAKKAIDAGFDELNFDYIRYPGFKKDDDVVFPSVLKNHIINDFANYLTSELKKYDSYITLSVDLFAYNMLRKDDLGIGQNFVELYDYFDFVSPMIYPSHYLPGNFGFDNPAEYPYEVVLRTIEKGKAQLWDKSVIEVGTTTPAIVNPVFEKRLKKLRPWLQDFNIGAIYNGEMIRKEKQAVYDAGLTSGWLLWNPRNVYTEEALDK